MAIVVDASVALKWVLEEENTEDAIALLHRWRELAELLLAPPIFRPEVTNALHRRVGRQEITRAHAMDAVDFLTSAVAIRETSGMYKEALALAHEFGLKYTYDSLYVALARAEDCELWTADRQIFRSAQPRFPLVRLLGAPAQL